MACVLVVNLSLANSVEPEVSNVFVYCWKCFEWVYNVNKIFELETVSATLLGSEAMRLWVPSVSPLSIFVNSCR
uniref:Uncharacterized protein n=1 Tax=Ignisphaera aggregans TaxID=334771 RepID=A0A7J2U6U3_9CREN